MKIVAFGASTSSTSINKTLATYAAEQVEGAQVNVLDLNYYNVPMFSEDKEKEIGQAEGAIAFLRELEQADAIVVSFAEHNGSYAAAYKNLFDWATRIERNVFQNKPVVYLATSPGPGGAQSVLAAATGSASFFGADVKASVSVPSFYENFDLESGEIVNQEIAEQVKQAVALLK
ncbi:NADPH-dependent FMN reductase [Vibrio parahaemolyticus]|uniref:NADPH-dependent FMN reductase n=1 Tax=Vibrio parahaemolyticus TaxID=670 RepID=UPI0019357E8A|nr:NADPH-dependent FMN reductase [Vibrio parahaemolyticus]EHK4785155.1 NAD(P)H-dependent oxidoreductase [Vibrio parahaemolyticus]EIJ0972680.1 NAD(P)H-dependent oxidoreductase [Vibrio parahaemolyticus]EJO4004893.1 NAD(P)H-dependent oxidoreductase [Vibrio parahaemolyticus]MBM4991539.1 NAD(P)H-dependent oxidoreductase [Vibrio parahaemolyticus]MBM4995546.1 NAD(P)H-dependent oxidoreductase [Vibrio parahaemolyticus]